MYLKVPVPANKGTRLLLRSTNASHLLLLISEPRLGWLDHQHPAAAQPKSPWEHPPADHPHRPGSHQQSHCPLSSFQKLNFAAHFDQIFYLKHMRSPPKTQPFTLLFDHNIPRIRIYLQGVPKKMIHSVL